MCIRDRRDDAAFFERDVVEQPRGARRDAVEHAVLREDRDAAAAFAPPSPPAVVAPPSPALPPRRPPAPSSPPAVVRRPRAPPAPAGPPPQRQWDEARPWVAADEALADIAEAASIVDLSTSGRDLDPRMLALVPWAHQIIELRTLIGAKGMETLGADQRSQLDDLVRPGHER